MTLAATVKFEHAAHVAAAPDAVFALTQDYNHPLETLAQDRLDRAFHAGRHLEEVRHRPHDARQRRRAPLVENGADARAVALAGAFERRERVETRPVSRQRNPRVRQRGLRLAQAALVRHQPRRQSVALTRERAELRACHVTRLGEARAERVDPGRLGFRLAELDRESLRAPANLRLTLPQLPRVPHEVNALRGDPDLLEPGCLGAVPLRGQGPAMALEVGGERVRRSRTLLGEP